MDELTLMADAERGVLRGQLTLDPHRSRRAEGERASELEQRVLSSASRSVQLEVDGVHCATRFEVRELWVPAGATLGDTARTTAAQRTSMETAATSWCSSGIRATPRTTLNPA